MDPRVEIHTLKSPLGALSPILTQLAGEPWLKSRKIQEVLDLGFDVIHWHNVSLVGGPGGLRLGKGVKLCTLHEYWFTCPTHILFKNNESACVERACIRCQLKQRRPPQLWRYTSSMAESVKHIDRFLAPSLFVQEQYRKAPQPLPTTVLPHFIPSLPPGGPTKQNDSGYYLYCGRLEKPKGLQTVLPVFSHSGRRLLIAGAGGYENELRNMAGESPNIEFLGRVPLEELPELYQGARATVVPSICYETFGLVSLESLRNQTPVISSSFGALPEVVNETGGGVVYSDQAEFKAVLDRFDQAPELALEMGRSGSRQLHKYSEELHLQRYFEIIDAARTNPA
jgi:glycosyltransferase involved in cell wall biosynthesis